MISEGNWLFGCLRSGSTPLELVDRWFVVLAPSLTPETAIHLCRSSFRIRSSEPRGERKGEEGRSIERSVRSIDTV